MMVLLQLLVLAATARASGSRPPFEEHLSRPAGIFSDLTEFKGHTKDTFEGSTAAPLRQLLSRIRREGWLHDFAEELTENDINELFGAHDSDMLVTAIPLINVLPAKWLELLEVQDFEILEKATETKPVEPFQRSRMSELPLPRQHELAPELPAELRPYLDVSVLVRLIESGRCDLLGPAVLKRPSQELARYLDGACIAKLISAEKLVSLVITSEVTQMLPDNAFEDTAPSALAPQTYRAMTVAQLSRHLRRMKPKAAQIKPVDINDLKMALQTLLEDDPYVVYGWPPERLKAIPPEAMSVFGRTFWAHVDDSKHWRLTTTQLMGLPSDAFADAAPGLLAGMKVAVLSESHKGSELLGGLLKNLGKDEAYAGAHPCRMPVGLLRELKAALMVHLQPGCVENMSPKAMTAFWQPAYLNALTPDAVKVLRAEQVKAIPPAAFSDNTRPFLKMLFEAGAANYEADDPNSIGCSGIMPEQMAMIKTGGTWELLNYECLSMFDNRILLQTPAELVSHIPVAAFERFVMPIDEKSGVGVEVMGDLLTKLSRKQLAALGSKIEDDSVHPCSDVKLDFSKLRPGALGGMPAACFGKLLPASLRTLRRGNIAGMSDDIFHDLQTQPQFAAIPADALIGTRASQLQKLKGKVAHNISAAQLLAMADNRATAALRPRAIAALPLSTFTAGLKAKIALPDDALAAFTHAKFEHPGWISTFGDALTPKQWRSLAALDDGSHYHPCSVLVPGNVRGTKTFWMGISPQCLAALGFLGEITSEELALMPDSAFERLTKRQQDVLAAKLGDAKDRLEHGRDCATYTAESFGKLDVNNLQMASLQCYANLQPAVIAALTPERATLLPMRAFEAMRRDQIAALQKGVLRAMQNDHWRHLGASVMGLCCSGFTAAQAPELRIKKLSLDCLANLTPEVFAALSEEQFGDIPQAAWKEHISRDQVAAIPARYMRDFVHFNYFGLTWPTQTVSLHPCLGVTHDQHKAMSETTAAAFEKQCAAIIADNPTERSWVGVLLILAGVAVLVPLTIGCVYLYWRHRHRPAN